MNDADAITTELVTAPTAYAAALIALLDRELSALYSREQRHGLTLDALFQPHVRFFVARLGGEPAGCGGVAFYDGFAEVKRMFVRNDARGRGVGMAILDRIELAAREAGETVLRLETGAHQAAAMRLYERAGFRPCLAFGDYADMPASAVATSVFFEKKPIKSKSFLVLFFKKELLLFRDQTKKKKLFSYSAFPATQGKTPAVSFASKRA